MKQLLLFFLLLWGLVSPATAQITITNSVFPVVGDTLRYAYGNQPGAINQILPRPAAARCGT